MSSSRENVIKAFRGEKPERIPVGVFLGGCWPIIKSGLTLEELVGDPSGDVISRKHFEEYALPYIKRVVKAVKKEGGLTMLHICGDVTDRLDLLAETGVDSLSVESKVSLKRAREVIGRKTSLAGNVNPVKILQFGSEEDVKEAVVNCLGLGAGNGGFVLLPGCDVASGVTFENIKVFVETGHNWNS